MPEAFVIGWPIGHSRSPLIHGYWLERYGLAGRYEKVAVAPENLAAFVGRMQAVGFVGGNVTIPHKETVARLCDRLAPAAERLGAVNTLYYEGGALCGDSTDGLGFLDSLDRDAPGWDARGGRAVVLGAGGAARAIVDALRARAFREVLVANRTHARAKALTAALGGTAIPVDALREALSGANLLVNTTSVGMAGQEAELPDLSALPVDAVVNDIVYVPKETPLLRVAAARGLRTVGGLGMLLHQAVPGFARWFGVTPEVTPDLRALVEADVAGPS